MNRIKKIGVICTYQFPEGMRSEERRVGKEV